MKKTIMITAARLNTEIFAGCVSWINSHGEDLTFESLKTGVITE
jgi:hypothetical protein